jgi:hypothetical protein
MGGSRTSLPEGHRLSAMAAGSLLSTVADAQGQQVQRSTRPSSSAARPGPGLVQVGRAQQQRPAAHRDSRECSGRVPTRSPSWAVRPGGAHGLWAVLPGCGAVRCTTHVPPMRGQVRGDCAAESAAAAPRGVLAADRAHSSAATAAVLSTAHRDGAATNKTTNSRRRARWRRATSGCNGP